jgi:hypothetical protein
VTKKEQRDRDKAYAKSVERAMAIVFAGIEKLQEQPKKYEKFGDVVETVDRD